MLGASIEPSPHTLPEALVLVDRDERTVAIDPAFCRAMEVDAAALLQASPAVLVGEAAFEDVVRPALRRCREGESVTHQIMLSHPTLGPRQFSVIYHPCAQADGSIHYCAMILRDVTSEMLAHDSFVLYSQWRDALNAIDRASLSEQSLPAIAAVALERLRYLTPYRQAVVGVIEELARAAGLDVQAVARTPAGLYVMAAMDAPARGESCDGAAPLPPASLRLQVQGDYIGELLVEPLAGQAFGHGQVEMMRELANRLERALHKTLLREKLNRYTVELEHAIAERTQEVARRRQAAEGLREILGFLNASRPLAEILNHVFKQAELLLGADAIAVFRPLDAAQPLLLPQRCIFAHSRTDQEALGDARGGAEIDAEDLRDAQAAVTRAVQEGRAVTHTEGQGQARGEAPGAGRRYPAQLVVPMLAEQAVLGVIIFFFADETDLAPEALELAVALGEQVVLATESAVLQQRAHDAETLEERERLARELHDAVTQSIYSLTLFAEAGRRLASAGQMERVQEYLSLLGDTAQQAMKQMRLMLYELRPAVLEQVGLVQALTQRLDAVERRAGIAARLEVPEPLRLSPVVEESLYRICQEALNNALKHAAARNVVVRLQREGSHVTLEVADDGVGFVIDQPGEAKIDAAGLGLNHIRERATRLNAALTIDTAPNQGTKVRVSLQEPEAGATTPWPAADGVIHYDWASHREPAGGDH
jgi:signal transduction histidine kinase